MSTPSKHIIRNARIENVGKSQSCMVSKPKDTTIQEDSHRLLSNLVLTGSGRLELSASKRLRGLLSVDVDGRKEFIDHSSSLRLIIRHLETMHD